jgi:cytochrome c2
VNLSNNEVCTVQLLAATAGLVKKFRGGIFSADDCEIASIEAIFDLDRFIANPEQIVPGNNMKPFSGLASADDRAKVIALLLSPTTNEAK